MTHACASSILDLGLAGHFATFAATPAGQPAQTQRDSSRRAITTPPPPRTCPNDLGAPPGSPITPARLAGPVAAPFRPARSNPSSSNPSIIDTDESTGR